jgi:hypothetical protein
MFTRITNDTLDWSRFGANDRYNSVCRNNITKADVDELNIHNFIDLKSI